MNPEVIMSRLHRQRSFARQRSAEIIREIEKRFAAPDYDLVRHLQNSLGIAWEDALHVEKLERQIDALNAQESRLGLSATDRQRRVELERQQSVFIRDAQRHAKKQHARKASANA